MSFTPSFSTGHWLLEDACLAVSAWAEVAATRASIFGLATERVEKRLSKAQGKIESHNKDRMIVNGKRSGRVKVYDEGGDQPTVLSYNIAVAKFCRGTNCPCQLYTMPRLGDGITCL
jgi:hypothetical protein